MVRKDERGSNGENRNNVKYALNFGVDYYEFEILLRVPQRSIIKSQK